MSPLHTCPRCGAIACTQHTATTWQGGSTRAWRRLRAQVLARDNHRCQRCGKPATHAGHIIGKALAGTNSLNNLEALCAPCNLAQNDGTPDRVGYDPQTSELADTSANAARAGIFDFGAGAPR